MKHHGEDITSTEELTPSLENMVVLLWLERIHVSLPGLIKQKYGSELRNKTLASLKSEISQSLDSLLEEVKSAGEESSRILRTSSGSSRYPQQRSKAPFCCLCHASKRSNVNHWLWRGPYLPESDKRRIQQQANNSSNRVRSVDVEDHASDESVGEDDQLIKKLRKKRFMM